MVAPQPNREVSTPNEVAPKGEQQTSPLVTHYLDLLSQVPGRLGKDSASSSAAQPIDTSVGDIYQHLFKPNGQIDQRQAGLLVAALQADQKTDIAAGGEVVGKGIHAHL